MTTQPVLESPGAVRVWGICKAQEPQQSGHTRMAQEASNNGSGLGEEEIHFDKLINAPAPPPHIHSPVPSLSFPSTHGTALLLSLHTSVHLQLHSSVHLQLQHCSSVHLQLHFSSLTPQTISDSSTAPQSISRSSTAPQSISNSSNAP